MCATLKQRMLAIKDNGLLPEGSALEGYDASHALGAWPVERVLDLALLASERNPSNLPKFIEALDDESEPVRWWAAQGCAMLAIKAAPAEAALHRRLDDNSGAVAVAAADALARLSQPEAALPVLEHRAQNTDAPAFILHAGNVLDRLGEIARPSLPAMKRALAVAKPAPVGTFPPQHILNHAIAVLEGRTPALVYPSIGQTPAAVVRANRVFP